MNTSFLPSHLADGDAQTDAGLQQMVTEFVRCALPVEVLPGRRVTDLSRQVQTVIQSVTTYQTIRDGERLLPVMTVVNQSATGIGDDVPFLHTVTMPRQIVEEVHVQVLVVAPYHVGILQLQTLKSQTATDVRREPLTR